MMEDSVMFQALDKESRRLGSQRLRMPKTRETAPSCEAGYNAGLGTIWKP
jgi:hypothetical protein